MLSLDVLTVPAFTIARDDAGHFRYSGANAALLGWVGFKEGDLIGRTPSEVLGEQVAARVTLSYARCLDEGSIVEHLGAAAPLHEASRWRTTLVPMKGTDGAPSSVLGFVDTSAESLDLAVLNRHLDLAIRSLKGADWRYDGARDRYDASPNLALLFGENEPRDVPWSEWESRIFPEDLTSSSCATLVAGEAQEQCVTFRFRGRAGETRWARCRRVLAAAGTAPIVCGVVTDVTEEIAREQQLLEEARTDSLTGLLNRRGFRQQGEDPRSSIEAHTARAVFMLDLDDFKRINDRLGHAVGDEVLVEVSQRLRAIFGPGVAIGRLGGDEFAVAASGITEREANRLAGEIGAALSRPLQRPEGAVPMSGSVGLCWRPSGYEAHALLAEADDRLYRAKRARKARLVDSDPDRQMGLFAA